MKKRIVGMILWGLFVILLSTGCAKEPPESDVSISSTIEAYTPAMSSVPGFPLTATINAPEPEDNLVYTWKAEQGAFLIWNSGDGSLLAMGSECTVKENPIYWAPDLNRQAVEETFQITVEVMKADSKDSIGQGVIEMHSDQDGLYSLIK